MGSCGRWNDGNDGVERQRAVLRNLQLRFCLSVPAREDGSEPDQRHLHVCYGISDQRGSYGSLSLDGLGFIVLGFTPGAMANGNWSVGLIADERASVQQREAIIAIASGTAGGPMAALSGLVGQFLGVESAPIRFDRSGAKWSVEAPGLLDMAAEGVTGLDPSATEPIHLDNTGHPAETASL